MPRRKEPSVQAREHLQKWTAKCTNYHSCLRPDFLPMSVQFRVMNSDERLNAVRFMLLSLTASIGVPNMLQRSCSSCNATKHPNLARTVFSIRGQRLCKYCFSAIVQLSPFTVERHAREIATSSSVTPYAPSFGQRRYSIPTIQTRVAVAFLTSYANEVGMECPTGRGASSSRPRTWLPMNSTRYSIHEEYTKRHGDLMNHLLASEQNAVQSTDVRGIAPLTKDSFCRVWKQKLSHINIMKSGSDFCDTCANLRHHISVCSDTVLSAKLIRELEDHRRDARSEFKNYKAMMQQANEGCFDGSLHFIFDFAEKVMLPRPLRFPSQLHFVTGLKFDLFGVNVSNVNQCDIFCLVEGHWPGDKTANSVCSMLHHSIRNAKKAVGQPVSKLRLHADNCTGQNKNRYVLWYFALRAIMGFETCIELFFMIAGHTKNRCDGAFGFVKRKLKSRDVMNPVDMVQVVRDSSTTNVPVLADDVRWTRWKEFLSEYFNIPTTFKISTYHAFSFNAAKPGTVSVKRLSTDQSASEYNLVKAFISITSIRKAAQDYLFSNASRAFVEPLETVPSAHDGNRLAYLIKNVVEQYFPGDDDAKKVLFSCGRQSSTDQ
ncbi:MAG: hypothetical protein AAF984_10995 [Verrucomicrobiota bacterium]